MYAVPKPDFFNTDLYKILNSLSTAEFSQLRVVAALKFADEYHDIVLLLEWVEKNPRKAIRSNSEHTKLTQKMLEHLYPGKPAVVAEEMLRGAKTKCLELVKEFIVWQDFQNTQFRKKLLLLQSLRKRNLSMLYEKDLLDTRLTIKRNDEFYDEDLEGEKLSLLRESYHSNLRKIGKGGRTDFKITDYPEAFFSHTLSERLLQIFIQQIWIDDSGNEKARLELQDETLQYVSAHLSSMSPRIQLLFRLCQCAAGDVGVAHERVLSALELWEVGSSLSAFEEYHAFLFLVGFFTTWANTPDMSAKGLVALERIYKRFNRKKIRSIGGMPLTVSLNLIIVLTNLRRFEEAEKFCSEFSESVQEEFRTTSRSFGRLLICVKRGNEVDREEAYAIVSSKKDWALGDTLFDAVFRVQKAKTLYQYLSGLKQSSRVRSNWAKIEVVEKDLENHLSAFMKFIKRNSKELGSHTEKFENFTKSMIMLVRFSTKNKIDDVEIGRLVREFKSKMPVGEEEWLKAEAYKFVLEK